MKSGCSTRKAEHEASGGGQRAWTWATAGRRAQRRKYALVRVPNRGLGDEVPKGCGHGRLAAAGRLNLLHLLLRIAWGAPYIVSSDATGCPLGFPKGRRPWLRAPLVLPLRIHHLHQQVDCSSAHLIGFVGVLQSSRHMSPSVFLIRKRRCSGARTGALRTPCCSRGQQAHERWSFIRRKFTLRVHAYTIRLHSPGV